MAPARATTGTATPNCWVTSNRYMRSRSAAIARGTLAIIVSRQSDFVTSNQKVRIASPNVAGGSGASHSEWMFHAYCSAPSAANADAIAMMRGVNSDRQPPGALASRNSV